MTEYDRARHERLKALRGGGPRRRSSPKVPASPGFDRVYRDNRLLGLYQSCPYRGKPMTSGCGCKSRCLARGRVVTVSECLACVGAAFPLALPAPINASFAG